MIWNFIRDFFVQYIFGGFTSEGTMYGGFIGAIVNGNIQYGDSTTADLYVPIGINIYDNEFSYEGAIYITMGDWLSTTATIICMVLISICFILLVRWIFKAVASAFLLK